MAYSLRMTDQEKQLEAVQNQASLDLAQGNPLDQDSEGLTPGTISEIIGEAPSEQMSGQGTSQSDDKDSNAPQSASDLFDQKLLLKEKLLEQAPNEPTMRKTVMELLETEKEKLTQDTTKFQKKGNYHRLSKAFLDLRAVVKKIEEAANASFESLKAIWLKLVHNFA
jgi:hypothetical protein